MLTELGLQYHNLCYSWCLVINIEKQGNGFQIDKPLCFYLSKLSTEELLKITYNVY